MRDCHRRRRRSARCDRAGAGRCLGPRVVAGDPKGRQPNADFSAYGNNGHHTCGGFICSATHPFGEIVADSPQQSRKMREAVKSRSAGPVSVNTW